MRNKWIRSEQKRRTSESTSQDNALNKLEDEKLEGDLGSEASSGASEAVLLCNRATVLLKLHELGPEAQGSSGVCRGCLQLGQRRDLNQPPGTA